MTGNTRRGKGGVGGKHNQFLLRGMRQDTRGSIRLNSTYSLAYFAGEEKCKSACNDGSDNAHKAIQGNIGISWDDRHGKGVCLKGIIFLESTVENN